MELSPCKSKVISIVSIVFKLTEWEKMSDIYDNQ